MYGEETQKPSVEVRVIQDDLEVAVVAFFQVSGHDVTIVTGIADPKLQDAVSHLLADSANAVRLSYYKRGDILAEGSYTEDKSDGPPF